MNAHPILADQKLRSAARVMTPLKAWRKAQLVEQRSMRITDVEALFGIKAGTWHAWEQPVGHPAFRRPDDDNMKRLFEITGGAIKPEDFYPVEEWQSELADRGG